MKRFFQYFGFVAFISLLVYGAAFLYEQFPKIVSSTLMVVGGVTLVALAIRLVLGKNWMIKIGREFFIGDDLIKALENFLKDLPNPKSETTANLVGHIIYRFTRLGLIGLVIAIIPAWLLYQQNQLFGYQNTLVNTQNYRMDLQNNLMEAERRSSLIFLMSNILDKVDEEIREQKKDLPKDKFGNVPDSIKFRLSKPLISRTLALSRAFRPYRILEGDTLSEELVSPERGQLIIALLENNLDSLTQNTIASNGDFSNAVVEEINLFGAKLREAQLSRANLRGADLRESDLREADLGQADLGQADLRKARLNGTILHKANLREANLNGADLREAEILEAYLSGAQLRGALLLEAHLMGANLKGADLRKAKLNEAQLSYANLNGSSLNEADLSGAILFRVDLRRAYLSHANLSKADLSRALLIEANLILALLIEANLSDANLNKAELSRANLSRAKLFMVNLRGADLRNANLNSAYLREADLSSADLREADLHKIIATTAQLGSAKSLYKVKNLHPDSMALLRSTRPCLFTEEGCE